MKIFVSFRYSGEDPVVRKNNLQLISYSLKQAGFDVYCSLDYEDEYEKKKFTNRQILEHDLAALRESDIMLTFVKSQEKSEGQLLEFGNAMAMGKKIVLALQAGVQTNFMAEFADKVINFKTVADLSGKLAAIAT